MSATTKRSEEALRHLRSLVRPDLPLGEQHDIKFLWHSENLSKVLAGRPFDAKPITMEIDATLDCNYKCAFCTYAAWEHETRGQGRRAMSREHMELVLSRIAEGGVRGVIFTGGGEPLMNPHTLFGLQYAHDLGLDAGIFTNGSLLTSAVAERVLGAEPEFIRISANAVTPEVYTRFHGLSDDRFATIVWKRIEEFARTIGTASTKFGLGVVVNDVNVQDLMPLVHAALAIVDAGGRIDYVAVRPVVNYGGQAQLSRCVLDTVVRARDEALRLAEGSALKLHFAMEYFTRVVQAGEHPLPPRSATHCIGHPWMASVAYTGDVFLCSEGKGGPANRIGNLLDQTLDAIWGSALRHGVLCGGCQQPPVCKARRLTERLEPLVAIGPLRPDEIVVAQGALDELRRGGSPDGIEFL
jgi:MoaA/NifB/PqqE/SkfB family radical SAM enzyme